MKKRIIVLLSAAVLLLLVTAVPASAKSHGTSFTRTHTWHSAPLKRWFKLELTGRIGASFTRHCSTFTTAYRDSTYGKAHFKDICISNR